MDDAASGPVDERTLRMELRFRNNVLWHAIYDVYPSIAAFCRANGLRQGPVGALLNLSQSPMGTQGQWGETAMKISVSVGIGCDELFPTKLYSDSRFGAKVVRELGVKEMLSLDTREVKRLAASNETPVAVVAREELARGVAEELSRMKPRSVAILRATALPPDERAQADAAIAVEYGSTVAAVRAMRYYLIDRLRRSKKWRVLRDVALVSDERDGG